MPNFLVTVTTTQIFFVEKATNEDHALNSYPATGERINAYDSKKVEVCKAHSDKSVYFSEEE